MRVAAIQFDIVWEDKPANHAIVERMLDDVKIEAGTFVLLPELGDTGFSFNLEKTMDGATLPWAKRVARERGIWLQPGYAERGSDGKGRNCAAVIGPDGEVRGVYQKVHPFSYGREIEHFSGGEKLVICEVDGAPLCPLICYDLRFPELWRHAALTGAEIFTIGASWPAPRQAHWRALLIARAIENQSYIVAVNRVGSDPHLPYAGGSIIVSPQGEVLAEGGEETAVLTAELDFEALREWRKTFPALRDVHRALLGSIPIESPHSAPVSLSRESRR